MREKTIIELPAQAAMTCKGQLDEVLRLGAQQMLERAIKNEVAEYLQAHAAELVNMDVGWWLAMGGCRNARS